MPPKPQAPRKTSTPPDSIPSSSDALPGDLRRDDQAQVPPDSLPDRDEEAARDESLGAHPLAPDGGDETHPIHDDDPSEDFTPDKYEEQIDEIEKARVDQEKRATADEP